MFEQRDRNRDLLAVMLAAITVLLVLSLFTYHRTDPLPVFDGPLQSVYQPDLLSFPPTDRPQNACGRLGAFLADLLLRTLGLGAYYSVATLTVLTTRFLLRRPVTSPELRTFGWLLSLIGLTTLAHLLIAGWSPGPTIGPGGYLGALVGGLLQAQVAPIGTFLIGASLTIVGLLLATDYLLLQLAALVAASSIDRTIWRRNRSNGHSTPLTAALHTLTGSKKHAADSASTASTSDGLSIKVRGRRSHTLDTDLEDAADDLAAVTGDGSVKAVKGRAATSKAKIPAVDLDDPDEEANEDDNYDTEEETEYEDDEAGEEDAESEDDETEEDGLEDDSDATTSLATLPSASSSKPTSGLVPFKIRKPPAKDDHPKDEREEVIEQLEQASRTEDTREYELPPIDLLLPADDFSYDSQEKEVRRKAKILEKTFHDFGFNVKVVEIETGPVIAQYEVELEAGLRLSKITGLADDLAIALRVPSVRIVAPIPGKNTVGIEVPNSERQVVRLREVMEESMPRVKKMRIPLFLGKDVSGNPLVADLSSLPHLLIAGRTGTGKSVCLNAIISSILMTRTPDEVRMLMIDPKMVELSGYRTLPHLMHPVVTDMRKAEAILAWAVDKMEERYALLARAKVRHIASYNQLSEEELLERLEVVGDHDKDSVPLNLPYIVIVADEMADLMMTAGKEVEQHIIRLAQKSRAVGIHLILATQKPTVDVITGLIKSNLPARIAFQVASRTDSRVVLDEMGADKLLGNGDMLFLWPGTSTLLRGQGTYLSDEEINAIVDCVSTGEQDFISELVHMKAESGQAAGNAATLKNRDELYESAIEVVIREGRGSVSLLQRALGIGYGRAARLIDFMAEDGIVGPYNGSQARDVVITLADWQAMQGLPVDDDAAQATKPPTSAATPSANGPSTSTRLTSSAPPTKSPANPSPPNTPSSTNVRSNRIRPANDSWSNSEDEEDENTAVLESKSRRTVKPTSPQKRSAPAEDDAEEETELDDESDASKDDEYDSDEYETDEYEGEEYDQEEYDEESADDEALDEEEGDEGEYDEYEEDEYESDDYDDGEFNGKAESA